jgi:hypothetical protein
VAVGAGRISLRGCSTGGVIGRVAGAAGAVVGVRGVSVSPGVGHLCGDPGPTADRAWRARQQERDDEETLLALEVFDV